MSELITREEQLLNSISTGEQSGIEPITREEMFLAKLGGAEVNTPTPITRKEQFLMKAVEAMSGGNTGGAGDAGGSGGGTEMFTGTLTLTEDTSPSSVRISIYLKEPDLLPTQFMFLFFSDRTESQEETQYVESLIRYVQYVDGVANCNQFVYGFNKGTKKIFLPYSFIWTSTNVPGLHPTIEMTIDPKGFNGKLAAGVTYRWYLWGDNLKQ